MKKLLLISSTILLTKFAFAQTNFKWDKIESVSKSKSQLYSDTKMFIAEAWKSSKDVIQNDDKDAGIVLVKGYNIQKVNHVANVFKYVYQYTVTFKMKENKCRITIDNVYCESAKPEGSANFEILKIEPFDHDYIKGKTGFSSIALPEKKAKIMMENLKADLQRILDNYIIQIKKESNKNGDW